MGISMIGPTPLEPRDPWTAFWVAFWNTWLFRSIKY
jgi:hypothetical protein